MYLQVLFLALWLGLGFAQSLSAKGQGNQLILTQGSTPHTYTLPGSLEVDMDLAKVLDMQNKAGVTYILLDVSGPSQRGNPTGFCGAGTESALVWLKLRDWKLYEVRPVTYASCLYNIELTSKTWEKNVLTVQADNFYSKKIKTLSYARARPEQSILVTEKPMNP